VALAFLGPPPFKKNVNHKDGQKKNNNLDNLEYLSQKDNLAHARRLGLIKPVNRRGENNPNAKLSAKQVKIIRENRAKKLSAKIIAYTFCISPTTVYHVCRKTWRHVA